MESVGNVLRGIFGYVLYPVLIVGVFVFLSTVIAQFVLAVSGDRRIRRLVAATLPLTVIVFALVPSDGGSTGIQEIFELLAPWLRFAIGGLIGVATLSLGRALARRDLEIATVIYVLFLSAVTSFILYCLVEGSLRNLHVFLLGLVLGGGLYIVLRGPPNLRPTKKAHEMSGTPPVNPYVGADPFRTGTAGDSELQTGDDRSARGQEE